MLTCMSSAYIPTSSHFSIRLNQKITSWPYIFLCEGPKSFAPTCIFFYHLTCYLPVNAHGCVKPTIKVDHFPRETTGVPHLFLCLQGISQCSGSRLPSRASPSQPGIAWGCLQTYAVTEALLLAPKPPSWSFEQMAAWSVTFATTEEAFQELAPLKRLEGREMTEGRFNSRFF